MLRRTPAASCCWHSSGRVGSLTCFPLGQEAEAQQAARGGAQQAGPERPRRQVRIQISKAPPPGARAPPAVAKAPPPEAADAPPGFQRGLPPSTPAGGQDPGAGLPPQGENTEARGLLLATPIRTSLVPSLPASSSPRPLRPCHWPSLGGGAAAVTEIFLESDSPI